MHKAYLFEETLSNSRRAEAKMDLFEIRFHGRGGQGAVTGAKLLGNAAMLENKQFQAFPHFGAERRGAPVLAFTRISEQPIRIHSYIYEPEAVVVLDETLLDLPRVLEGIREDTHLIVNTPRSPEEIQRKVKARVSTVDATKIALDAGLLVAGLAVVNTIMLGAIARATGIVSIESVKKAILEGLTPDLGEEKARANVEAAQRAYDELRMGQPP